MLLHTVCRLRLSCQAKGAGTAGSVNDGGLPTGLWLSRVENVVRQALNILQAFVFVGDSNNAIQIAELLNQVCRW